MSTAQKHAWFNLVIVIVCVIAVMAGAAGLGFKRGMGGFGILGFLGFGPLFFLRRAGRVVNDERDAVIHLRSWMLAYAVFWVLFVGACVMASYKFESTGAVPLLLVQYSVWCGVIVVVGLSSLATLIQYGWGGSDGAE